MKYIVFHFHDFGLGGVQRKILDLCNYLATQEKYQDWTPVLVMRWKSEFSFFEQIRSNKVKVLVAPKLMSKLGITYAFYLSFVFLWLQPKVVVTFLHSTLRYVVFARVLTYFLNCKLYWSQDNIFSLENTARYSEYVFSPSSLSIWARFFDGVITMTYLSKVDLHTSLNVPLDKIKVIPNWLPLNLKIFNHTKKFDLVFAGRLSAQKNVLSIIDIVRLVKLKKKDIRCLIIGNGVYKQALEKRIKRFGLSSNVKVLSANHYVSSLISMSRCFVLSSKFEGHPLVLLEAMKLGAIPIVKKYPGLTEYFVHSVGGYIYSSELEAAGYILLTLFEKKHAETMRSEGQNFINNFYNKKRIQQTIDFFIASDR